MTQAGHVPGAGSPAATASERARRDMLRDARVTARGGLIVLFAALIGGISNLFGLLIQPRRG